MISTIESAPVTPPGVSADATVVNPSSQKVEKIYKNIEDEPLIKRIKQLEGKLLATHKNFGGDYSDGEIGILETLLNSFKKLLEIEYGPLGYLVCSDSESIIKLYGVDTDQDFYAMIEGSRIRVSSPRVERAVRASGRRFIGEEGLIMNDPAETTTNARLSDEAIDEITNAIVNILKTKGVNQ